MLCHIVWFGFIYSVIPFLLVWTGIFVGILIGPFVGIFMFIFGYFAGRTSKKDFFGYLGVYIFLTITTINTIFETYRDARKYMLSKIFSNEKNNSNS